MGNSQLKYMNKQIFNISKSTAFFFAILVIIATLSAVSAQEEPSVCCISLNGCDTYSTDVDGSASPMTAALCSSQYDGTFRTVACSTLEASGQVCEPGCCCVTSDNSGTTVSLNAKYGNRATCGGTALTNEFFVGDPLATNDNYCKSVCGTNQIEVTGKVTYYDDDSTPARATLVFTSGIAPNIIQVTANTNNDGTYSVKLYGGREYNIYYEKTTSSSCNDQTTLDLGTTDVSKDLVLPCNPDGITCQDSWEITYSDTVNGIGCGTVGTVTYTGSCAPEPQRPLDPGDYVPCPTTEGCKPDGFHDAANEECDPYIKNVDYGDCESPKVGKKTCSITCEIVEDTCFECPDNPLFCTEEFCDEDECNDVCGGTDVCAGAEESCAVENLEITSVVPLSNPKGFRIDWAFSGENCEPEDIANFNISGCATNLMKCSPTELATESLFPGAEYFEDRPFAEGFDSRYCYLVTANMIDSNIGAKPSNVVCGSFYENICEDMNDGAQICVGNILETCQGGEIDISDPNYPNDCSDQGKTCVQKSPDKAECMDNTACEFCSGPFGSFGYENYELSDDLKALLSGESRTFTPSNCEDVVRAEICYEDDYSLELSSVGQYKACATVNSCYDYRTKTSCEANTCNGELESAADACAWRPLSEGGELGFGVCLPTDVDEQDCTQCVNSPLGYCSKEICTLYGTQSSAELSKCFYNEKLSSFDTDKDVCVNKEKISCETYDNEEQCTDGVPFDIRLAYEPLRGSNAVLQDSTDLYGLGRCYWAVDEDGEGSCIKDSDNSRTKEDEIEDPKSDCPTSEVECLLDMQAPNTTIFLDETKFYSQAEIQQIAFKVEDNMYTSNVQAGDRLQLETFFDVAEVQNVNNKEKIEDGGSSGVSEPSANHNYPALKADELVFEGNSKKYSLAYFSKDYAQNVEEIKYITINVMDPLDDSLSIKTETSSEYIPSSDVYETNLSVQVEGFTPVDDDAWLKCTSTLIFNGAAGDFAGKGDGTKPHLDLNWKYLTLQDGTYWVNITCFDNHLQMWSGEKEVIIDADPTISEPSPRGEKFTETEVEISIKTNATGHCVYLNNEDYVIPEKPMQFLDQDFQWTDFDNTDDVVHTATLTGLQKNKIYFYYVACNFVDKTEDSNWALREWFHGNYADLIYFAVDATPPEVKVVDANTEGSYLGTGPVTDELELEFSCKDVPLMFGVTPYHFGCDQMKYCEYIPSVEEKCVPDKVLENLDGQIVNIKAPNTAQTKALVYYARDKGGNEFTSDPLYLRNLRDTNFRIPNVTICDPEKGIPCKR